MPIQNLLVGICAGLVYTEASDSDAGDFEDASVAPSFSADRFDGITLITTVGVDFSADTVGARFVDGFDTWVAVLHLLNRASDHGRISPIYPPL